MVFALIFAGGKGTRMHVGDKPKQFLEIDGKSILCHTIEHFQNNGNVDKIIVVSSIDWLEYAKKIIQAAGYGKVVDVIPGGDSALNSQYLGLQRAAELSVGEEDIVLVHDGVRPLITDKMIDRCIESVRKYGNAITTAPAIETIITADSENRVEQIIDRSRCQLARAPQGFFLKELLDIHNRSIREENHNFIDSASMMMNYGYRLHTVAGSASNIKVTTVTDYYMCKAIFEAKIEVE